MLTDLRSLNFWEEIVPIDATNVRRMLTDPVILAVFVAGVGPLLFVTLTKPEYQRYAFSVLFAFLWGIVFKSYIIRATAPTWILTASSVFTAAVGRWLPWELSRFYGTIAENSNIVISLFGNLFWHRNL